MMLKSGAFFGGRMGGIREASLKTNLQDFLLKTLPKLTHVSEKRKK